METRRMGTMSESECGQNPFECGCLNVNFESKVRSSDRRDRKGEMWGNPEDRLRDLREETGEVSLRVERLERAWAWWNVAWCIRTGSRMNSAGKRRVSRAVHQAMSRQGEQVRTDMNKLMAYLQDAKLENLSDNVRELAFRQAAVTQTEDT